MKDLLNRCQKSLNEFLEVKYAKTRKMTIYTTPCNYIQIYKEEFDEFTVNNKAFLSFHIALFISYRKVMTMGLGRDAADFDISILLNKRNPSAILHQYVIIFHLIIKYNGVLYCIKWEMITLAAFKRKSSFATVVKFLDVIGPFP